MKHDQTDFSRFLPVTGYEGLYEVSDGGEVRNAATGRVLRTFQTRAGYLIVQLFKGGRGKNCKVHRLVAAAFIRPPEGEEQVNHIDLDKCNNHVSNLEWCTAHQNRDHFYASHKFVPSISNGVQAAAIAAEYQAGGISQRALAAKHGVTKTAVVRALVRHQSAGPAAIPSKAAQALLLRPNCRKPGSEECPGHGRQHCTNCRSVAAEQREVA